eukprot:scaffold25496_cov130-Isochrysis_galbana.AAC.1
MVPKIFLRLGHRPRCTEDSTCLWQKRQADGWSANLLLVPILLCDVLEVEGGETRGERFDRDLVEGCIVRV